ncbi:hypothetical protein PGSY75_0001600A, partial [Plasmodium gaboni]
KGCPTNINDISTKCNIKDFESNRFFYNIFDKKIKRYIFNNLMIHSKTNYFDIENKSCVEYDKIKNIPYICNNIKYDIHKYNNKHIYSNNSNSVIIKENNMDLSSFLKNIIFNMNYLLYLFNKNNHIYFVLHLLFKNDILLQRNINMSYKNNIYNNIYNMYNISSVLNYKNDILNNTHNLYNIYDLFALFIFYVHIKRFYFDFFLLILKRINNIERTNEHHNVGDMNNMCDMNNMSDINN